MKNNHISIVIPTRNRLNYLKKSIDTVLRQSYCSFTLIVVNNYCSDGTYEYLNSLNDHRLNIINSDKFLSMTESFLLGLRSINKEGWFCLIGDDDGLAFDSLKTLNNYINKFNVEFIQSAKDYYRWDTIKGSKIKAGDIIVNDIFNQKCRIKDIKLDLQKCFYGDMDPLDFPRFYTGGFSSTKLLFNILTKDRNFLKSSIPDIYSSLVISKYIDKYLWCPIPLVISGTSSKSNGAAVFNNNNNPEIVNSTSHGYGSIPIHPKISMGKYFFPRDNSIILLESLENYPDQINIDIDLKKIINKFKLRSLFKNDYSINWINEFSSLNNIKLKNYTKFDYLNYAFFFYIAHSLKKFYLCNIENNNDIYNASIKLHKFRSKNFTKKLTIYVQNKIFKYFIKFKLIY